MLGALYEKDFENKPVGRRPDLSGRRRCPSIAPGQQLPAAVVGAGQPPLPAGVFAVSLPGVLDIRRGVEVARECADLLVVLALVQLVHPGEVFRIVGLVAGIAEAVELTAEEGEAAFRCSNEGCPSQRERRIVHFASRDAMDIEGMGPSVVRLLCNNGLIKDPADIYSHTNRREPYL